MYQLHKKVIHFPSRVLLSKEFHEQIDGQGEDVGVVVLCRDGVEGLQVAQLERGRGLVDDVGCLAELLRGTPLPIGCYHLRSGREGGRGGVSGWR